MQWCRRAPTAPLSKPRAQAKVVAYPQRSYESYHCAASDGCSITKEALCFALLRSLCLLARITASAFRCAQPCRQALVLFSTNKARMLLA